ncbi:D-amino-acid oxidase [Colletotrichum sp. SAR 10_99]|nr:D-amino-acid oxidase [Colletotrichum sp. SAR 10_96]KAJ5013846.1 D-amino-acid oxidase [Colletotrichum sp. SAR 10_99]
MASVTILGAGVTGMTIASQLANHHDVTIVGDILPGDALTTNWASPWAGACWVGVHTSSEENKKIQLESLAVLLKLARTYPETESGVRLTKMTEILEYGSPVDIWYRHYVPDFRLLDKSEMPPRVVFGMEYTTVCISPPVFLTCMRARLEAKGVQFVRARITSLRDLKIFKSDVLVNAAGARVRDLTEVRDTSLVPYRLQSILLDKTWDQCYIYRGLNGFYFNMFGRPDGTTYVGGIKLLNSEDRTVYAADRETHSKILSRGHQLLPSVLPSPHPSDYDIKYDIGNTYHFRPMDQGGARIDKEIVDGQKVVHAYGQEAGGYCFSFGTSQKVAALVEQLDP